MKVTIETGFTLIELMVTLVIVIILASVAIPALQSILATRALNTTQENFAQALSKAGKLARARSTIAVVDISGNVATLTLADNSSPATTYTASNSVAIANAETYTFFPAGNVSILNASSEVLLSSVSYSSLPSRSITVSETGVVNVSR